MGKSNDQAVIAEAVPPAETASVVDNFAISLDEFCQRLSTKKVSSEMIGGFHHAQRVVGNVKGKDAAFSAAFASFVKQPV